MGKKLGTISKVGEIYSGRETGEHSRKDGQKETLTGNYMILLRLSPFLRRV